MNAKLIYGNELKPYTVKRLQGLTDNEDGEQVKNYNDLELDLAVYHKGSKSVKKVGGEDSYIISTIHIYCDPDTLSHHDIIPYGGDNFTVLEVKTVNDYTFAKGICADA